MQSLLKHGARTSSFALKHPHSCLAFTRSFARTSIGAAQIKKSVILYTQGTPNGTSQSVMLEELKVRFGLTFNININDSH